MGPADRMRYGAVGGICMSLGYVDTDHAFITLRTSKVLKSGQAFSGLRVSPAAHMGCPLVRTALRGLYDFGRVAYFRNPESAPRRTKEGRHIDEGWRARGVPADFTKSLGLTRLPSPRPCWPHPCAVSSANCLRCVPAKAGALPPGNATHFPAWMASAAKPHRWHQAVGKVAAVGGGLSGGLIVHSERIADR